MFRDQELSVIIQLLFLLSPIFSLMQITFQQVNGTFVTIAGYWDNRFIVF